MLRGLAAGATGLGGPLCWDPREAGPPALSGAGQGRGPTLGIQEPGQAKWASNTGQGGGGRNAASFTAGPGSLGGLHSVQTLVGPGAESATSLHLGLS